MYWEKELETIDRRALESLQLDRLNSSLRQAVKSPGYCRIPEISKIVKSGMTSIAQLGELPFTTKEDLRQGFPWGFLSMDKKNVVRLHSSSGTTGNPTVVYHNREDLQSWANLMARSLFSAGIRDTDVFQNMSGYGLFTGGLGFQYGVEKLGCLSIPSGAGNSLRQIKLMRDFGTTVAHAIPSYLGRLFEVFKDEGLDPRQDTQLHTLVIGAEPHSEEHRRRIEELFGVKAYNSFGLSEMNGPGVAFECTEQNGLHVWEDAYVVEIIDPLTLQPVAAGEIGELVMTTLDRQAMPLIRYRTRDLTRFIPGPCRCGRTHRRLDRIAGRSDDMFIIKGCNIFPMQIEGVLLKLPEVGDDYRIIIETIADQDEMLIEVEVKKQWFTGDLDFLAKLENHIARLIRDEVLVRPLIKLVEPGSIPKSEGKAVRVFDHRQR
ncbi:MAG: phenylacetate--CoA ligase [Proteobacteria bacterium]|nr:phenylacetate--CoA ligase [Pseudomonadota bacterium]